MSDLEASSGNASRLACVPAIVYGQRLSSSERESFNGKGWWFVDSTGTRHGREMRIPNVSVGHTVIIDGQHMVLTSEYVENTVFESGFRYWTDACMFAIDHSPVLRDQLWVRDRAGTMTVPVSMKRMVDVVGKPGFRCSLRACPHWVTNLSDNNPENARCARCTKKHQAETQNAVRAVHEDQQYRRMSDLRQRLKRIGIDCEVTRTHSRGDFLLFDSERLTELLTAVHERFGDEQFRLLLESVRTVDGSPAVPAHETSQKELI